MSQQVERLLRRDFILHLHTLNFWRLGHEPDAEDGFSVTPLIRHIWQECYKQEYGRWLGDDAEAESPEDEESPENDCSALPAPP